MYKCDTCEAVFDKPLFLQGSTGNNWTPFESVCPVCGHDWFTEVKRCPVCGELTPEAYPICENCIGKLKIKFNDFLRDLEPAEVEVLDSILDGASIGDFFDIKGVTT